MDLPIGRILRRHGRTTWTMFIGLSVALLGCTIGHGLGPVSEPQKEMGGIRGRITFKGTWPDSVAEVRVVVYADYPPSNFYRFQGFSDPIPIGVSEYTYAVLLEPGTYASVFVVWRKEGLSWPESVLRVRGFLGRYPDAVQIEPGGDVMGIDLVADFESELPPELREAIQSQGG